VRVDLSAEINRAIEPNWTVWRPDVVVNEDGDASFDSGSLWRNVVNAPAFSMGVALHDVIPDDPRIRKLASEGGALIYYPQGYPRPKAPGDPQRWTGHPILVLVDLVHGMYVSQFCVDLDAEGARRRRRVEP
jgi:hypothetical protein